IERTLASLANERNRSLQYDRQRNEPIRDLTYDLVDAVHLILGQMNEKRSQSTIDGYSNLVQDATRSMVDAAAPAGTPAGSDALSTPTTEENQLISGDYSHAMDGQDDPDQIDSFEDVYVNKLLFKHASASDGEEEETHNEAEPPIDNQVDEVEGEPEDNVDNEEDEKIVDASHIEEQSLNERKKRKRKSHGDGVAAVKTPSSELRCALCDEYGTRSVRKYVLDHLRDAHHTHPKEAGVFFRCSCGEVTQFYSHFYSKKCVDARATVVCDDENVGGGRREDERKKKRAKKEKKDAIAVESLDRPVEKDRRREKSGNQPTVLQ
ncbi:hypothetical protein PFISCL1PPCAC_11564, partial [Pristionchus fissidentatus]